MKKEATEKGSKPIPMTNANPDKGGFAFGKLLALLIATTVVGFGVWKTKDYLATQEEEVREEKYHVASKSDFLVTVKLTGQLKAVDEEIIKCNLEGQTTIVWIEEEGKKVKGPTKYVVQNGDTLASIAEYHNKESLNIKQLNKALELDWDNLEPGTEFMLPGDLILEFDPLSFKERINGQEINLNSKQNELLRAEGDVETAKLSAELYMKQAQSAYTNSLMLLDQLQNNTITNFIETIQDDIKIQEKQVVMAEQKLKAFTQLKELGFVSEVDALREQINRDNALHAIKVARANLETFLKYKSKTDLSQKLLEVEEARVRIEKQRVDNAATLRDVANDVLTKQKVLEIEQEKLEDLQEQMANTKVYATQDGTVLYFVERYSRGEPIQEGAKVWKGKNIIKLPRDNSLKVDLSVPQAKRNMVEVGMRVYIGVEDIKLPGTLTFLSSTVDSQRRGHTEKSYFKGEVTIDTEKLPDSISEGMAVTVEIHVINLDGENQMIKLPNQCVTTRMVSEDTPQTGCWILDEQTGQHEWRPVTIEYSDETHIAIRDWAALLDITTKQKPDWWRERVKAKAALDKLSDELSKEMDASIEAVREQVKDLPRSQRQVRIEAARAKANQVAEDKLNTNAERIVGEFRSAVKGFLSDQQLGIFDKQKKNFMAFFDGVKEGELVHLSPLTEAENLNLEEAVMGKGNLNFSEIKSIEVDEKGVPLKLKAEKDAAQAAGAPKKPGADDNSTASETGTTTSTEVTGPVAALKLTAEQLPKWEAAKMEAQQASKIIFTQLATGALLREQLEGAFNKVRDDLRVAVEKFLDEEQLKEFDKQWKKDARGLLK